MSRKIKLQNSTILLIGIILIVVGVLFGFYEYFEQRKDSVYAEMNIMLYENEMPEKIESDDEIKTEIPNNGEGIENHPSENDGDQEGNQSVNQYSYIGILEIPEINLKRGFLNLDSKYNNVDYNITLINGSNFPNEEKGNLILAAHSGTCQVCFFDELYKLDIGDTASVYYNNIKYTYSIQNIYEVEKDGTVAIYRNYDKNCLTLITCTRNSNTKQTVYIFELTSKENY